VADFPLALSADLTPRLAAAFDVEGKIPRALEALGPLAGADVLLVDGSDGLRAGQLRELGARLRIASDVDIAGNSIQAASADAVVGCWSWFRTEQARDLAAAQRVLRPGGRILIVHDYGRDDVSRLRPPDLPEYTAWSRRDGWFLRTGFKVRVIHCWWTFDTLETASGFLEDAFGADGRTVASGLKRPRLSYNVAIYHRSSEDGPSV
jgi:SAM-dependent methyltransferase